MSSTFIDRALVDGEHLPRPVLEVAFSTKSGTVRIDRSGVVHTPDGLPVRLCGSYRSG